MQANEAGWLLGICWGLSYKSSYKPSYESSYRSVNLASNLRIKLWIETTNLAMNQATNRTTGLRIELRTFQWSYESSFRPVNWAVNWALERAVNQTYCTPGLKADWTVSSFLLHLSASTRLPSTMRMVLSKRVEEQEGWNCPVSLKPWGAISLVKGVQHLSMNSMFMLRCCLQQNNWSPHGSHTWSPSAANGAQQTCWGWQVEQEGWNCPVSLKLGFQG